jgi:tetratricopeptide (TPR) repeat protein
MGALRVSEGKGPIAIKTARLKESRLLVIVAALALLGATPGILVAFKVTNAWALAAVTAGTAVIIAVAAVWQERYKQAVHRSDEQALKIEGGCLVLPTGALPTVGQVTNPIRLGVHPAAAANPPAQPDQLAAERVPVYVPRDIDDQLREYLARGGFVLLVGDSTAGKSRAAYEAMRSTLPDHVLIAPTGVEALIAAIAKATGIRRCVLWLNDLEAYLGAGGLNRASIGRLLDGEGHHRIILATLRAVEEDRLTGSEPDQDGRRVRKDAREALEQAYRIPLGRVFSPAERERAHARDWDSRIFDALAHATEYGIAEYLAAGPELVRDWENAWSPNTDPHAPSHPRAAALIAAAVDLRRAGYTSLLPRALLTEVHEYYLTWRGGVRLRPESLDEAWSWATRPRRATTALLHPTGEQHVQVFDYLVDTVQRRSHPGEHVPDQVVQAALNTCPPGDADTISYTAYDHGRYRLAEIASRNAFEARKRDLGPEHPDTLASRRFHANMLRDLGRYTECEDEHRIVRDISTRVFGPEHPDTLWSRHDWAFALIRLQRYDEAEEELRAIVRIRTTLLGAEHMATITSRHVRAIALSGAGRLAEAEAENRNVLAIRNKFPGPEHPVTLFSRGNLADDLYKLGRLQEAETEQRATLDIRTRVLGAEHPDTLWSREALTRVLTALGRLQEAETETRTVLEARSNPAHVQRDQEQLKDT